MDDCACNLCLPEKAGGTEEHDQKLDQRCPGKLKLRRINGDEVPNVNRIEMAKRLNVPPGGLVWVGENLISLTNPKGRVQYISGEKGDPILPGTSKMYLGTDIRKHYRHGKAIGFDGRPFSTRPTGS